MNLALYMIGALITIGGLAYAAHRMGVGTIWIVVGVAILLGLGMMGGVVETRQKDAPS